MCRPLNRTDPVSCEQRRVSRLLGVVDGATKTRVSGSAASGGFVGRVGVLRPVVAERLARKR